MAIQSLFESYGDDTFNGLDMTKLGRDEAYLIISNSRNQGSYLYSTYTDCINCPFLDQFGDLPQNMTTRISTSYERIYKVLSKKFDEFYPDSNDDVICDVDTKFGQFGVYNLKIEDTGCTVDTLKEPVNIYLPILTVFCIYFCLFGIIAILMYLVKTCSKRYNTKQSQAKVDGPATTKKDRVKSLDTFRGITICLMIFVNYGGGGYNFIEHAIWNGLHIADLVFPWFMWIMGVCIPISIKSTIKRGVSTKNVLLNIARRSAILFMIGIFLGSSSNLNKLRVFGVLQRFGICYFVVASICYIMMKKYENDDEKSASTKLQKAFLDVTKIKFSWAIMILILLIHTLVIFLVPFENCSRGYLGPGGYHERGTYQNCTGGITGYIDKVILGNHVYQYAEITHIYKSLVFDPEGIFGCLTSIVQVFIGVQAGVTLMTFKVHKDRLVRWFSWGVILGILGGAFCGFSRENGIIPINKHLWSLSFVLVTSSFAFILLALCYILVDYQKLWSGKPFLYAGMNAIIMYIGHSMVHSNFPFRWYIEGNNTHFINLLENIWATLMWIFVAFILYRKKYFLSI